MHKRFNDAGLCIPAKHYITDTSAKLRAIMKLVEEGVYHQIGLQQFSDYLDGYSFKEGFLLIFDFRKSKEYKQEHIPFGDKEIFAVWV